MLPSFLLINSIFSDQLTRSQRIEQLTFGCSLVLIYYNEYMRYDFDNGLQRRNKNKGSNLHMTLHDPIWARKYISLTISLANVLSDQRYIHLGSCGSHFFEHFFGMVRRFCGGNDSADAFQNAVTNIVIYKILQKENLQDLNIQPGRSDSGSRLDAETQAIKQIPMDVFLKRGIDLTKKVGNLFNQELEENVDESVNGLIDEEDIINYITSILLSEKKSFNSTSTLRNNTTSGYTSIKRMASGNFF